MSKLLEIQILLLTGASLSAGGSRGISSISRSKEGPNDLAPNILFP